MGLNLRNISKDCNSVSSNMDIFNYNILTDW